MQRITKNSLSLGKSNECTAGPLMSGRAGIPNFQVSHSSLWVMPSALVIRIRERVLIGRSVRRVFRALTKNFVPRGEILRPELSNLSIPVFAVQFPIFWKSHVEFAYRHFRQVHAVPFLRDARIEAEPNGIKKSIGHEWMLYSVIKQWKNLEIELVGAAFKAGNAYGALSGKMAYSLFTQVTFGF